MKERKHVKRLLIRDLFITSAAGKQDALVLLDWSTWKIRALRGWQLR